MALKSTDALRPPPLPAARDGHEPSSGCRVVVPPENALAPYVEQLRVGGPRLDRAGRYELLLPIARGGMGAVWAARLKLDGGFEKIFAVKTLLSHLSGDPAFRTMFLDEARIAAGIEHPNVAQIVDFGEDGDLVYLVMEWVEGETLHALARAASEQERRVPLGVGLRILADTCLGLHAVHEHTDWDGNPLEIVHRDVSPHNLLISARGVTKVIDFGVAQARGRTEGTTEGQIKGKVRFMAPEQACGRRLDRRADVWAVGAILYKLVTGKYPYPGESDIDFIRMMKSGRLPDAPPSTVPRPIQRVLKRALSFAPALRHPSALALAEDLEAAAHELDVTTDARGVAACLADTLGPRVSGQRGAIRAAIEERQSLSARIWSELPLPSEPSPPLKYPTLDTLGPEDETTVDLECFALVAGEKRRFARLLGIMVAIGIALGALAKIVVP